MQINVPEILSHFKFGAASFDGIEPNRAIAEFQHWDDRHKILWLRFSDDIPHTDRPFMLKCINKEENLYVILKGSFDGGANSKLHHIRREYPPFRAFFVTGLMIAKKENPTMEANLNVIHNLKLQPAPATHLYRKAI